MAQKNKQTLIKFELILTYLYSQFDETETDNETKDDFNYLLSMPLWNLTLEKKEEILKQQKEKTRLLKNLREKSIEQLWLDDLNEFTTELDKFEIKEKEDSESTGKKSNEKKQKAGFNVNSFLKTVVFKYHVNSFKKNCF